MVQSAYTRINVTFIQGSPILSSTVYYSISLIASPGWKNIEQRVASFFFNIRIPDGNLLGVSGGGRIHHRALKKEIFTVSKLFGLA